MGLLNILRWFTFVVNLLFWILGIVILIIGFWLRFDPAVAEYIDLNWSDLHEYYTGAYILIAVGVILTLIGFLGCCGAWRKSTGMLTGFFIVLFIAVILELVCGILMYMYQDKVKHFVYRATNVAVRAKYGQKGNERFTKLVDKIQKRLQCCGVTNYRDWTMSALSGEERISSVPELGIGRFTDGTVPQSCCNDKGLEEFAETCGSVFNTKNLDAYESYVYNTGCANIIGDILYRNVSTMIGLSIAVCAIQLIGMLFSMLLCACFTKRKQKLLYEEDDYY